MRTLPDTPLAASEHVDQWSTCQKSADDRSMSVDSLQRGSAAVVKWHPWARDFCWMHSHDAARRVDDEVGRRHLVTAPGDMTVRANQHEVSFVETRELAIRDRHDRQGHRARSGGILERGDVVRGRAFAAEQREPLAEQIERGSPVGHPGVWRARVGPRCWFVFVVVVW